MSRSAVLITVAVMVIATQAVAQPRASFSVCEALAEQRASGPGPSERTHNQFMRDCLAGKVPLTTPPLPRPASEAQVQSFEKCEALAEQRGAGGSDRNHRSFMRQCMAGRIR